MLWGTTGTSQAFSSGEIPPIWIGALRLALAALTFWAVLLLRSGAAVLPWRARSDLPAGLVVGAALAMAAYNLSFFAGVRLLGVGVGTALCIGSGPLWAGLMQWTIARRAPGRAWWLGTAVSVAGAVLLLADDPGGAGWSVPGLLLCLGAGASYAAFALLNGRLVRTGEPLDVTARVFGLAAVVAVAAAAAQAWPVRVAGTDIIVIAHLGVVATGLSYALFAHGQRHVSAPTAVTLALAEPATAFMLALLLLGETLAGSTALGLALLLAGLLLVVRGETRDAPPA